MLQVAKVYHSFAESEQADREFYAKFSMEERLELLLDLIARARPDEAEQRFERVYRIVKLKAG